MRKRRDNSFDRALVEVLVLGMLVTSGLVAVVVTSPYWIPKRIRDYRLRRVGVG